MFLTQEYYNKKESYKTLQAELTKERTNFSTYLDQTTELMNSAQEQFANVSIITGIPHEDVTNKWDELMEELTTEIDNLKKRKTSISDAINIATQKNHHYLNLYVEEKKAEDDYNAEQTRITMENIKKQQDALKENKLISRN